MIFFSLTEAPLPDPTPTPPNTPKRTRNGPETDPKQSQTEPNGAETEPNGAETEPNGAETEPRSNFSGWDRWGGCWGRGGGGVVREKENHCPNVSGTSAERSWHERFFSRHEFSNEKCSGLFPQIFEPHQRRKFMFMCLFLPSIRPRKKA